MFNCIFCGESIAGVAKLKIHLKSHHISELEIDKFIQEIKKCDDVQNRLYGNRKNRFRYYILRLKVKKFLEANEISKTSLNKMNNIKDYKSLSIFIQDHYPQFSGIIHEQFNLVKVEKSIINKKPKLRKSYTLYTSCSLRAIPTAMGNKK